MKYLNLTIIFILLTQLMSCGNDQNRMETEEKREILKSAFQIAFSDEQLISPTTLTHVIERNDSTEVASEIDSIWIIPYGLTLEHLPTEEFKFKITSFEEICDLPKSYLIPYILEIEITEYEQASTAKVKIETTCRSQFSDDCKFGFMCGSGLGLELNKTKDGWKSEISAQWTN
ncbi:MAG: hypothetical protein OCD00_05900 [Colwellia sp.]